MYKRRHVIQNKIRRNAHTQAMRFSGDFIIKIIRTR